MANVDIRPLSLGEILDRSFSLYRENFRLFAGISVIPHLIVLLWNFAQLRLIYLPSIRARALGLPPPMGPAYTLGVDLVSLVAEVFLVYLLTQAPTAYAVSELYFGRTTSVRAAVGRLRSKMWRLASGTLLTGAAILLDGLTLCSRRFACQQAHYGASGRSARKPQSPQSIWEKLRPHARLRRPCARDLPSLLLATNYRLCVSLLPAETRGHSSAPERRNGVRMASLGSRRFCRRSDSYFAFLYDCGYGVLFRLTRAEGGAGPAVDVECGRPVTASFVVTFFGGAGRDRTADKGFADLCLTTWRPRPRHKCRGGQLRF